jgi:hypothetical protein
VSAHYILLMLALLLLTNASAHYILLMLALLLLLMPSDVNHSAF